MLYTKEHNDEDDTLDWPYVNQNSVFYKSLLCTIKLLQQFPNICKEILKVFALTTFRNQLFNKLSPQLRFLLFDLERFRSVFHDLKYFDMM